MIDPLLDQAIMHAVNQQQYGNYVLRRMVRVLNLTDSDLMAQLMLALEGTDANSFKVKRLDALLASVRKTNAQAYAALYGALTAELSDYAAYEGQYQYDLYRTLMPVSLSIAAVVPEQAYAAALAAPFRGRLLREWASNLEESRLRRIKDTIAIGYNEGKTTAQIIREIRGSKAAGYADGLLDTSRNEVDAVVRTALSHTAQMTRSRFYDANADILGDLVWISTLDSRTTSECRVRDHKRYTKEHVPVGHKIPWLSGPGRLHWRCRSTSIAMLKGQKSLFGTRSAAGGPVDANLSYGDWLKQQGASVQDDVLGKTRGAQYRAGGMNIDTFTNDKGRLLTLKEMAERDARGRGG